MKAKDRRTLDRQNVQKDTLSEIEFWIEREQKIQQEKQEEKRRRRIRYEREFSE